VLRRLRPRRDGPAGGRYVESIRFGIAKSLLDQGHTATRTASLAGFPSYESLRRVFARELSLSPAAYQRRFATARRDPAR
jgi:transcriptional regulator GlxA family with amidase domain